MPPLWGLKASDTSIAKAVADLYANGSRGVEYDPQFGDISPPRLFCAYEAYRNKCTRTAILFLMDAEVSTDCIFCYRKLEEWLTATKFVSDDDFAYKAKARLTELGKEHDLEHVSTASVLRGLGESPGRQAAGESTARMPDNAIVHLPSNDLGQTANSVSVVQPSVHSDVGVLSPLVGEIRNVDQPRVDDPREA